MVSKEKFILGKVFISHSSKDKPFVRRLTKRLWENGYQVWLDEKELVPGDALSTRLSDALSQCRVVIVVVTEHSVESKWLAFELNKATERMVEGHCRVIPILKGDVEPPTELKGLIYADFRKSFADGCEAVFASLQLETEEAVSESWERLAVIAEDVFGFEGFVSFGDYQSSDYNYLQADGLMEPLRPTEEAEIVYDVVHDYIGSQKPLGDSWWAEYQRVQDNYPTSTLHLVISERPVEISELEQSDRFARIKYVISTTAPSSYFVVVFADISRLSSDVEHREVIQDARAELHRLSTCKVFADLSR